MTSDLVGRRFTHTPRSSPSPSTPEAASEDSPRVAELKTAIEAADAEHRRLLADYRDGDYAYLRQTHLAGALVWSLRATLCFEQGNHDGARKASQTADAHAAMAHKLEQTSAVDRLAELERMLSTSRRDAQRLAKMK